MSGEIALGFGNNIDYEIMWDSHMFEDFIIRYQICDKELSTNQPINNERDLVVSCLAFLKEEIGGERFVASSEIIKTFSKNFKKKVTLGGTSVRAMFAMHKIGYTPALHLVNTNDYVRKLIPKNCPYISSSEKDSLYPHLVIQFNRGIHVSAGDINICTTRSNRVIYNNDVDNINMKLSEKYFDLISKAKVVLISGFNMIQDRNVLNARLDTLLNFLEKLPQKIILFYEDACFYNEDFSKQIFKTLSHKISILSLNEDELQGYLKRKIDLKDVVQVKQALFELHNLFPVPIIIVHTRHWALAYGENANKIANALKSGIAMATTRFQYGDDYTIEDFRRTEKYPHEKEGKAFSKELNELLGNRVCCCASLKVKVEKATTVGLGDSFVGGFLPALLLNL